MNGEGAPQVLPRAAEARTETRPGARKSRFCRQRVSEHGAPGAFAPFTPPSLFSLSPFSIQGPRTNSSKQGLRAPTVQDWRRSDLAVCPPAHQGPSCNLGDLSWGHGPQFFHLWSSLSPPIWDFLNCCAGAPSPEQGHDKCPWNT